MISPNFSEKSYIFTPIITVKVTSFRPRDILDIVLWQPMVCFKFSSPSLGCDFAKLFRKKLHLFAQGDIATIDIVTIVTIDIGTIGTID